MYMIVERQYMDVKNILYLHKYLCRFSFKIRKEKKSLMVWEAALLASKAKINVFQKQNLNGAVPIIWNLDIFSPFWRVVKLLYLVSAKGFLAYIARQGNTPSIQLLKYLQFCRSNTYLTLSKGPQSVIVPILFWPCQPFYCFKL